MRELLLIRDWSSITLSDVARRPRHQPPDDLQRVRVAAGPGAGLYALRLADRLVDQIEGAIGGNVGDIYAAFLQGFRDFSPSRPPTRW
jgi:hypothetical protein